MPRKVTTKEFKEKAKKVHGDKYGYEKVKYIKSNMKVEIICPDHGSFWQTPNNHLNGKGCFACGGKRKLTTKEFIEKAKKVHGDRYGYGKVKYVNTFTKIEIICPDHGSFWQAPTHHLGGRGCSSCVGKKIPTTKEFIEKAKKVHGDRYGYGKVKYVNNSTKIEIICPDHGSFWQTPNHHLSGQGCRICAGNNIPTTKEFIEKAKKVHGDRYGYEKLVYIKSKSKVEIICPDHGSFWQKPYDHLRGCGCLVCAGNNKITTEEFIEKAKKVHGDRYGYENVIYINMHSKVEIICPDHGSFWQTPNHHLRERGCPSCAITGFDISKPAILYILDFGGGLNKIGITNRTVKQRFTLEDLSKVKSYQEFFYYTGAEALKHETQIKRFCKEYQYKGDEFLTSGGNTEIFQTELYPIYKEIILDF